MFCHLFERDGVMCLFDGIDGVSLGLQVLDGVEGILVILPFDGFFSTEGGLMDLRIRRTATYSAQHHTFNTHGVSGAKDSTHVMLTAYVIQHHDQRQFICLAILGHVHATHLSGG